MRMLFLLFCAGALVAQEATVRLSGRVLDAEGRGLPKAIVSIKQTGGDTLGSGTTDGEGRFALSGKAQGYVTVGFEASGRLSGSLPLLLRKGTSIVLEARLPLMPWEEPKGPIPLMGLLDGQALPADAKLTPQKDGTWAWEIAAKEGSELQAGAMVRGYDTHPGHTADAYKDGSGIAIYRAHGGRIRFVLDPRRMGRPGKLPEVTVQDPAQDGLRPALAKTALIGNLYQSLARSGAPPQEQINLLLRLLSVDAGTTQGGLATIYLIAQAAILNAARLPIPRDLADRILADLGPDNYIWQTGNPVVLAVLKATADPKASFARMKASDQALGGRFMTNALMLSLALE